MQRADPRLRAWWTDGPADLGRLTLDDPDVQQLVKGYEDAEDVRLTPLERTALAPNTASVPLYAAALDGFAEDPAGKLRARLPFLRLSEWLLARPADLLGHSRCICTGTVLAPGAARAESPLRARDGTDPRGRGRGRDLAGL
jgi:hypothetical protein